AVAGGYYGSSVSVLLGNGDGTFDPAIASATGYGPLSLAVGDFDGDGNLDLVTANFYGPDVSVLLGNGDGAFQAPSSISLDFPFPQNPASMAVGDFNGDGKMDLGVIGNYDDPALSYANVLLGNGDGSFSGPNSTFLGFSGHAA